MASITLDLRGTLHWAKVFEFNRDMIGYQKTKKSRGQFEDCDGAYTIQIDLEPASRKALAASDSAKDSTKEQVKFIRKHVVFDKNGDEIPAFGGPPKVFKADGITPWNVEEDGLIGNGSKGVVRVEIYELGEDSGEFGTRLKAVQIVNHIPYESDSDWTPPEDKPFEDLSNEVGDDEIPF